MAKDFLGQELQVGDKVVCIRPRWERMLIEAEIIKMCPIKIKLKENKNEFLVYPCNTVKIQEVKVK